MCIATLYLSFLPSNVRARFLGLAIRINRIKYLAYSSEFVLTARIKYAIVVSMTKAFAYLRVSGKGQLEGDGFTRQLTAIKKFAAANNIRIVRIFREEGISGTKDLENRPALQDLLVALHSNGTKLVLVEKLDRLARDLMIQESIIADMKRNGFEIASVTEPDLCSDDPSRVLMRQILGAFAQYERAMIVQKLRGARQRMRVKTGRCEGRKPYGTRPGETEIIERMKALRSEGLAVDKVAATLNSEGAKPRAGQSWYATSVYRVLKSAESL
jgi:DNA invertase Pin-like site-specific DNA recombinase